MSTRFAYRSRYGAYAVAEGRARFALWAPACAQVSLEIEGREPLPMPRSADGLFEREADCGAGTRYRYRVREDLAVPDPAARLQCGDVHDASLVTSADYAWRHPDWCGRPWAEIVIYELHVGVCGGFDGVRQRLPQLAALGVTALELMPIADFPGQRNWGYDGVLPYAPDTTYGSPEQLKALIDAAHGHGLCIYLDVVYNHFGPDGNYLHAYAPQFFDERLHCPWGAAIDFGRPQVRRFFIDNALYWLMEFRFDGLRFDAVHAISDPGFLDEMATAIRRAVEPGRQVHLVLENERNAAGHLRGDFDAQWNDDGHNVLHHLLTGEADSYYSNYRYHPTRKLARCLAEGFIYQGEPMPSHQGRPRGTPSADLPPTSFVLFLQNHDQVGNRAFGERLTTLADPAALRAAIGLQLLAPQIPLLFMGEEWGCREPFLFFTDFHDALAEAVREGRRREFADVPAFADAQQRARIPDPNAAATFGDSVPDFDRPSAVADGARARMLDYYRGLLRLRAEHIVPQLARARSAGASAVGAGAVIAAWALGDGSTLRIAVHLGAHACACEPCMGRLLFESAPGAGAAAAAGRLLPRSTAVFLESATEGGAEGGA